MRRLVFLLSLLALGVTQGSARLRAKETVTAPRIQPAAELSVGRRRALVVGISKYRDPRQNLRSSANDAESFARFLGTQANILGDYEVETLTDHHADKDRIQSALFDLSDWGRPGDTLLLYFSGHAYLASNRRAYFFPHDGELNRLRPTGIELSKIFRMVNRSGATTKVVFLDCCYAGSTVDGNPSSLAVGIPNQDLDVLRSGPGVFVLMSSEGDQYSWEDPESNLGFFTKHLMGGLEGGADGVFARRGHGNGDGWVSASELANYVRRKVTVDVKTALGHRQTPRRRMDSSDELYLTHVGRPERTRPPTRTGSADSTPHSSPASTPATSVAATASTTSQTGFRVAPAPTSDGPLKAQGKNSQGQEQYLYARDGSVMIHIPAGPMIRGSAHGDADEQPVKRIEVSDFLIDKYEVSNLQYQRFTDETGYVTRAEERDHARIYIRHRGWVIKKGASWRSPLGPGSTILQRMHHPVVCLSYDDCQAYLKWAGKRLPTEAEWEKAARGRWGQQFPWGESGPLERGKRANFGEGTDDRKWTLDGWFYTSPVNAYPRGASHYGIYQMSGNVWEWCEDWFAADYYTTGWIQDPVNQTPTEERVVRGGGWNSSSSQIRCSYRGALKPDTVQNNVGFRGAISLGQAKAPTDRVTPVQDRE